MLQCFTTFCWEGKLCSHYVYNSWNISSTKSPGQAYLMKENGKRNFVKASGLRRNPIRRSFKRCHHKSSSKTVRSWQWHIHSSLEGKCHFVQRLQSAFSWGIILSENLSDHLESLDSVSVKGCYRHLHQIDIFSIIFFPFFFFTSNPNANWRWLLHSHWNTWLGITLIMIFPFFPPIFPGTVLPLSLIWNHLQNCIMLIGNDEEISWVLQPVKLPL